MSGSRRRAYDLAMDLIEADPWPHLKPQILEERDRRLEGLMRCATLEQLRHEQGFIDALNWVLDNAKPPKPPHVEEQE